jgi:protein phosphatase 1 regulatory subunit 7
VQKIELPESLAPQLVELELYDNLIKHTDGLEACTALTTLDLSYNKLKHIKHVEPLTALTHIYFVQNRISRIENLATLTNLTYLELGANRISEIDGIATLTNLTSLWLGQNRISELKNLATLTNLRTLSIQANRLTSLSGIETLPQLTELYVSDNKIPSLAPLAQNTQLEILDFQSNPISSLEGLENLAKLENVWASNCQVADFREIERALADKESLEEVYFEGNPVQKREPVLYRNKLRLALPQVAKIDACELSDPTCLFMFFEEGLANGFCDSVRESHLRRRYSRNTISKRDEIVTCKNSRHKQIRRNGHFPAFYHKEWDEKKAGKGNNLSIFTYHHIWPTVGSHIDDDISRWKNITNFRRSRSSATCNSLLASQ